MNFDRCVHIILKLEDEDYLIHPTIERDPKDPGGTTKYGIDQRSHPGVKIEELSLAQAMEIYRTEYWQKGNVGNLPEELCLAYFDACVNQGKTSAAKCLQQAVHVEDDGIIGKVTRAALACHEMDYVVPRFLAARALRYAEISGFGTYGLGWMTRLAKISLITGASFPGLTIKLNGM